MCRLLAMIAPLTLAAACSRSADIDAHGEPDFVNQLDASDDALDGSPTAVPLPADLPQGSLSVTCPVPAEGGKALFALQIESTGYAAANAVAVDRVGNAFVAGTFDGTLRLGSHTLNTSGFSDAFVAKVDPTGHVLFAKRYGNDNVTSPRDMVVTYTGHVIVTGTYAGSLGFGRHTIGKSLTPGVFLVELDASGREVWARDIPSTDSDLPSMAIDADGNIFVSSPFSDTIDLGTGPIPGEWFGLTFYVAKLEPSGQTEWVRAFRRNGTGYRPAHMGADSHGNLLLAGEFEGALDFSDRVLTSGAPDTSDMSIFLAKLDPDGRTLFAENFGPSSRTLLRGLAVDDADNVVIAGSFVDSIEFDRPLTSAGLEDIFIARLDPEGRPTWSERFGDGDRQDIFGVAVDACKNIGLFGAFNGSVQWGAFSLTATQEDEMFVSKLDETGSVSYALSFSSTLHAGLLGPDIAFDPLGNALVYGDFEGTADFGNGHQAEADTRHGFIVKLSP